MKKLQRIPQKGALSGVLAGFAAYFNVDVTLLRIIFVLFVFATGFFPGVIAYLLAIFIMPVDHTPAHGPEVSPGKL